MALCRAEGKERDEGWRDAGCCFRPLTLRPPRRSSSDGERGCVMGWQAPALQARPEASLSTERAPVRARALRAASIPQPEGPLEASLPVQGSLAESVSIPQRAVSLAASALPAGAPSLHHPRPVHLPQPSCARGSGQQEGWRGLDGQSPSSRLSSRGSQFRQRRALRKTRGSMATAEARRSR